MRSSTVAPLIVMALALILSVVMGTGWGCSRPVAQSVAQPAPELHAPLSQPVLALAAVPLSKPVDGLSIGIGGTGQGRLVKINMFHQGYGIRPAFDVYIHNAGQDAVVFSKYFADLGVSVTDSNGRIVLDPTEYYSRVKMPNPVLSDVVILTPGETIIIPVGVFGNPGPGTGHNRIYTAQVSLHWESCRWWPPGLVKMLKSARIRWWGGKSVVSPLYSIALSGPLRRDSSQLRLEARPVR